MAKKKDTDPGPPPDEPGGPEPILVRRWVARPGSRISQATAEAVGGLVEILNANGGATARNFWEYCQHHPDHALNAEFDWDNATAGDNWRDHQARHLMGSVCNVWRRKDETEYLTRAFAPVESEVVVPTPAGGTVRPLRRYVEIEQTYTNEIRKEEVLTAAYRRMRSLRESLFTLLELFTEDPAWAAQDEWIAKLLKDLEGAEQTLEGMRHKGGAPEEETEEEE